MDARLISICTGASIERANVYAPYLAAGMSRYGIIDTPARTAMFLASVGHESGGLARTAESLNYTVDALLAKFGRHRITAADARRYGRTAAQRADQQAIANCIYGGAWGAENLGNTQPGDGWKFRGAGLLQSTGRSNVELLTRRLRKRFAEMAVPDFTENPEKLTELQWAALSACDFIDRNGLNERADQGDFDGYCDVINLGAKTGRNGDAFGWSDRVSLYEAGMRALKVA